jgi:hypothetical protein
MKSRRRSRRAAPRVEHTPLSSHFTREGPPKKAYRTMSEARAAAQLAWTFDRVDLDAYRCEHCYQWHIGRRFRNE